MVRTGWVLAGTLFLVASGHLVRAADAEPSGFPARYIVLAIDETGAVKPQYQTLVRLASPRPERSEADLAAWLDAATAEDEHVAVRLLDADGRVAFRETVTVPRWLRTEVGLHGDHDGGLTETLVPMPGRAFVVRVPVLAASRLHLTLAQGGETGLAVRDGGPDIDLDALAADSSLPLAGYKPAARLLGVPPPTSGNRVDLLVMGDGYTAAQSAKFATDSTNVLSSFFNLSPYSLYNNYFNTATLFTASNQSGADHPDCHLTDPTPDPLAPSFVDTAFDATFCTSGIQRLLTVNTSKVLVAAAALPDHDEIMVVVNDDTYGGSGGGISTVSTHPLAVNVAQHEFGHTFSHLADEYTSPYPGFPACSDLSPPGRCEPNVTDQTDRTLLKWTSWVLGTTPIPTVPSNGHDNDVGLFQGARYQTTGMYRPKLDCLMNHLGVAFCPICAQEFILRLYRGGWGVPAAGIDNIEPGSESPTPGAVTMSFPGSKVFSFSLLQPTGGTVVVSWQVNGAPQAGANSSTFNFTAPAAGVYTVKAVTQDATSLVQPAMAGTSLVHSRTWTVTAGNFADLSVTKTASGPARDGQPLVYTIVARNAGPEVVTGATVADTLPAQITGATWTCTASAGSSCPASGSGNVNAPVNLLLNGSATFTVTGTVAAGSAHQIVNTATITSPPAVGDPSLANNTATLTTLITKPVKFYTVPPCRIADTRGADAPALAFGQSRTFAITSKCQVPPGAWAVSLNLTVTNPTKGGDLRVFPAGSALPPTSAINYGAGQTRANNAVITLDGAGQLAVFCEQASGTADFILDVNGYFQ